MDMKKNLLLLFVMLFAITIGAKADDVPFKFNAWLIYSVEDAEFQEPTLEFKDGNVVPVTYFSSDPKKATVDAVTGEVTLLEPGNTNITAIHYAGDGTIDYETSYLLVILGIYGQSVEPEPVEPEPGTPRPWSLEGQLYFVPDLVNAQIGKPFTEPTLKNPQNVTVTYSSSKTDIATVNPSTGAITLVAPGVTTITATFAGNSDWKPFSASYTLIVTAAQTDGNGLSFGTPLVYAKMGVPFDNQPKLKNPNNLPVYFVSTNPDVAKVDPLTGNVTLVSPGNTNITAIFPGSPEFAEAKVSYLLVVLPADVYGIWFDVDAIGAVIGKPFSEPKLNNPYSWTVTYSSSNEKVATVDEKSGAVTIVGVGKTIITATAVNEEGETFTASYELTVTEESVTPGDKKDGDLWFKVVAGETDGVSVFKEPELNNPYNLKVTYSSSNEKVIKVDASTGEITVVGNGAALITATVEGTDEVKGGVVSYSLIVEGDVGETPVEDARAAKAADGQAYNAAGLPVGDNYRGFVIINGKKYLKK